MFDSEEEMDEISDKMSNSKINNKKIEKIYDINELFNIEKDLYYKTSLLDFEDLYNKIYFIVILIKIYIGVI